MPVCPARQPHGSPGNGSIALTAGTIRIGICHGIRTLMGICALGLTRDPHHRIYAVDSGGSRSDRQRCDGCALTPDLTALWPAPHGNRMVIAWE
jgi:hypothetical protein